MDTNKALDLIKEGIKGLLEDIATGADPWVSPKDLAEGSQIDDEMIFEWICKHKDMKFRLIVGEADDNVADFVELIVQVLNSEWYSEVYQSKVDEVRIGRADNADWERTKKSLKPTWMP